MDVRIGVTQATREISIELEDDAATRKKVKAAIEAALSGTSDTLWITDKRGRDIGITAAKIGG